MLTSHEIFINETEIKPNRYATSVLSGVVGVILVVFILNEIGIFEISRSIVRVCLVLSLIIYVSMQLIIFRRDWLACPSLKYWIMGMVLFLVLAVTTLLNIHAILAFVLPVLVATQYRSKRISTMALTGSVISAGISPLLSFLIGSWNLNFMTGLIQTLCRVTVQTAEGNELTINQSIEMILLYWALPQMLIVLAFGIILFSVTKSGIDSVTNQVKVNDLKEDLQKQLDSINQIQEKVLCTLSDIIETRDSETGGHVRRTSQIVHIFTESMLRDPQCNVSKKFCNYLVKAAPMHDLGKISIPDTILRKPGRLTVEEYDIVKRHPIKSEEIIIQALTGIEDEQMLATARNVARYHHERMDGSGYPDHLKGRDIPLEARIMAIADVYDALVSERCYKVPMAFNQAFDTIESLMGSQFDPTLNPYFIASRDQIEAIYTP